MKLTKNEIQKLTRNVIKAVDKVTHDGTLNILTEIEEECHDIVNDLLTNSSKAIDRLVQFEVTDVNDLDQIKYGCALIQATVEYFNETTYKFNQELPEVIRQNCETKCRNEFRSLMFDVGVIRNMLYKFALNKELMLLDRSIKKLDRKFSNFARDLVFEILGDGDKEYSKLIDLAEDLLDDKCEKMKDILLNTDNEELKELSGMLREALIEKGQLTVEDRSKDLENQIDRNVMNNKEIQKRLKDLGYTSTRQTGSHKIYQKDSKTIPVPIHNTDMGKGLSIKIQKQSLGIK